METKRFKHETTGNCCCKQYVIDGTYMKQKELLSDRKLDLLRQEVQKLAQKDNALRVLLQHTDVVAGAYDATPGGGCNRCYTVFNVGGKKSVFQFITVCMDVAPVAARKANTLTGVLLVLHDSCSWIQLRLLTRSKSMQYVVAPSNIVGLLPFATVKNKHPTCGQWHLREKEFKATGLARYFPFERFQAYLRQLSVLGSQRIAASRSWSTVDVTTPTKYCERSSGACGNDNFQHEHCTSTNNAVIPVRSLRSLAAEHIFQNPFLRHDFLCDQIDIYEAVQLELQNRAEVEHRIVKPAEQLPPLLKYSRETNTLTVAILQQNAAQLALITVRFDMDDLLLLRDFSTADADDDGDDEKKVNQ